MKSNVPRLPPVIVLGGGANALSIVRSLGRIGVTVHAINAPKAHAPYSRYCRPLPTPAGDAPAAWTEYLLGSASEPLRGSVLLAASDAGIRILADHRPFLAQKFLLDESNPVAQLAMLDKLSTYQAAAEAGLATPRFWTFDADDDPEPLRDQLPFPLIVKPRFSHLFESRFGAKFLVADDFDRLRTCLETVREAGIQVLLLEKIPGPDDRLCSYYTYLDEWGNATFDFTKRILRRFPENMGAACYHVTDRIPELREPALALFRHVGLRGLANVEFKRDPRDGQLKLIECNARFTAANGLLADCGLDLARYVYDRLTGRPPRLPETYRTGVRLWYPLEDFQAFWALRRQGRLSTWGWLKSVARPQTFPFFRWRDPWPTLSLESRRFVRAIGRIFDRRPQPPPPSPLTKPLPKRELQDVSP